MEAAAETIRNLTRTILPERPHQLAQDPEWKSAYSENSRRPEEWSNSRLQYMTLVSEADRGVLFTRGYYDIRAEAPKPAPREVTAIARGSAKKLSLSDYNKKKTGTPTVSISPPDTTTTPSHKKPSERSAPSEPRPSEVTRRSEKSGASDAPHSTKSKVASNGPTESILPPKPASLPPRPPSPESRKRVSDADDLARPSKRPKPHTDDRRDGHPIRRPESSRDHTPLKDGRPAKGQPLTNGKSVSKSASTSKDSSSFTPPRSRESNGVRQDTERRERPRGGSIKVDMQSKNSVPPLLSPLRLDIDGGKEAARKGEKRPRDGPIDSGRVSKARNGDSQSSKRPKSPFRLPPLLSPTLPAEVEAELERDRRRKASPTRTVEVRPAASTTDSTEATKRVRSEQNDDGGRKIVKLKIPRKLRSRFGELMALSKKAPRQDRPSSSIAAPVVAEKRPVGLGEESIARKTRAPEVIVSSRMPSTPSKRGAPAMSRVSSSGSLARTPGDAVNATPSVTSDRLLAPEQPVKMNPGKQQSLRELDTALMSLGKKLKHNGDLRMKARLDPNAATNGTSRGNETNTKLGYVLILESTIAFMMGFHAQDTWRTASGRVSEIGTWLSLFPLLDFLQKDMRRQDSPRLRPLFTLSMVLQVFAYDEVLRAQGTHENPPATLQDVFKARRSRERLTTQIRDATSQMDSSMCPNVTLYSTVEEVANMAMRIITRWCADESLDWTPQLDLKEMSVKNLM